MPAIACKRPRICSTCCGMAAGRAPELIAAVPDRRSLRSSPNSGERASYDGAKRKKGFKRAQGHRQPWPPSGAHHPPADSDDLAQVASYLEPCRGSPARASKSSLSSRATRPRGRPQPHVSTASHWKSRSCLKPDATLILSLPKDVLLPPMGVMRSFARLTRFYRLVKDHERYASTLTGLHLVVFVCIMLRKPAELAASSQEP